MNSHKLRQSQPYNVDVHIDCNHSDMLPVCKSKADWQVFAVNYRQPNWTMLQPSVQRDYEVARTGHKHHHSKDLDIVDWLPLP